MSATTAPGMVEQTYLKAEPGARAALARYIVANWLAMDRVATEQGWFDGYTLHENADGDAAGWDLLVTVHYRSADGYADPATQAAFEAIRRAHREVSIDGRRLAQLGRIVRHQRLRPIAPVLPPASPLPPAAVSGPQR
ncbi:hypothetical protein GVO57_08750 [Sphingomonas changnyeongensis]|uniref:NIPSNAP domain-containing protein n=1 Tax=Sphingomonas changnyeongensis TaxID=2698679 RepID=A0A7Z2NW25_9SPHN|nr:hypothetical protein [Sphingomonas changnyeongensis]QHL90891.1 hypothetical protein GVO57_08750 [Sphingomonas changnyeongensis]